MRSLLGIHKLNPAVRILIYSDVLMISGWGLVEPLFAVYVTDQIKGASLELIGIATAVFFVTKSFLQLPIARYLDKHGGEQDDFKSLILGSLLACIAAGLYIFIDQPWQVLVAQAIQGIGGALAYPAWLAIFTRHIDKHHESYEWSLYDTATDIGASLTAALSGILAGFLGFRYLFIIVALFLGLGTLSLTRVARDLKKVT